MLLRYFFGDDIFISYTRADAITYAAGLASQLTARDFSCFLDQWGTPPGRELPAPLKRALARSLVLVLVGSEGVVHSRAVELEVKAFRKSGRTIVPIDFGALERVPWFDEIAGLARTPESPDALKSGEPSAAVLARVEKSFQFTRRNQRARRSFGVAAALLLLLAVTSLYTTYTAHEAAAEAETNRDLADKNRRDAEEQEQIARKNLETAEENRRLAEQQATEARRQEDIAKQQERFARSRALAATASERLFVDPAEGLALAQEAWTTQPTDEARVALRDAVLQSHLRLVVADHTGHVGQTSFSADGTLLALAVGAVAKVLETRTGRVLAELRGHTQTVRVASFSPTDDELVLTASDDRKVRIWRWRSADPPVELLQSAGGDLTADFSADGRYVITSTTNQVCAKYMNYENSPVIASDSQVRVWDVRGKTWIGAPLRGSCVPRGRATSSFPLDAVTDGRILVSSCANGPKGEDAPECGRSRVTDVSSGADIGPLEGDDQLVDAVVSEKAGVVIGRVVTKPSRFELLQTRVRLWSLKTGAVVAELGEPAQILSVAADGMLLVTAHERNAFLWRIPEFAELSSRPPLTPTMALVGHTGRVERVVVTRDNKFVVTAGQDQTSRVWDLSTGRTVAILRGHTAPLNGAAVSRDGRSIITSSADGTARLWRAAMAQPLTDLRWSERQVQTARFVDGRSVVAIDDQRVRTWHPDRGAWVSPELPSTIKAVTDDASVALVAAPDRTAWVHATDGRWLLRIGGKDGWIRAATFSEDGRIFTQDDDRTVGIWNGESGRFVRRVPEGAGSVRSSDVSTDGRRIATSLASGRTIVWDAASGERIGTLDVRADNVRLSSDGQLVLTFDAAPFATLWDTASGKQLTRLGSDRKAPSTEDGHRQTIRVASFSRDNRRIVTVDPYAVIVWTPAGAEGWSVTSRIVLDRRAANLPSITDVALSPDGERVLAVHVAHQAATMWDASTGRLLRSFSAKGADVTSAAFSADGRLVVTADKAGSVVIWESSNGQLLRRLTAEARDLADVTFSPDSRTVLASSTAVSNETFAWRVADGKRIGRFAGQTPRFGHRSDRFVTLSRSEAASLWQLGRAQRISDLESLSSRIVRADFSRDGRYLLAATEDGSERVWDTRTGQRLLALRTGSKLTEAAPYSPDWTGIVSAPDGSTALLWERHRGALANLRGAIEAASVFFNRGRRPTIEPKPSANMDRREHSSRDGRYRATVDDAARTIRIEDVAGGRVLADLRGQWGAIHDVSFSYDGHHLVTTTDDGARVWETRTGTLMSELLGHDGELRSAVFSVDDSLVLTKGRALSVFVCIICGSEDDLVKQARGRIAARK